MNIEEQKKGKAIDFMLIESKLSVCKEMVEKKSI